MPQRSRYLGKGQIAVCMRSGIKCHASELVRDGRIPSLLVLPDWADPPQPQERPYVPNDLEGKAPFDISPDITPLTPPVLAGEAVDETAVLTWSAAVWEAGPRTDLYRVMRDAGAGFLLIGTVTVEYDAFGGIEGPALTYTDTDVAEGETLSYRVIAVASGRAARSNTVEVTIPVEPPPVGPFRIITEGLDNIVTEDGDYLVYQGS